LKKSKQALTLNAIFLNSTSGVGESLNVILRRFSYSWSCTFNYNISLRKKLPTIPTLRIIGEPRTQWNRRLRRSNHYTSGWLVNMHHTWVDLL